MQAIYNKLNSHIFLNNDDLNKFISIHSNNTINTKFIDMQDNVACYDIIRNIILINKKFKEKILNRKIFKDKESNYIIDLYNLKSLEYLSNYQNRYNSLKELSKPIIGTNQIQLIEPSTKKIKKKVTLLNICFLVELL